MFIRRAVAHLMTILGVVLLGGFLAATLPHILTAKAKGLGRSESHSGILRQ